MQVEAIHPETGEKIIVDIPNLTEDKLDDLLKEHASDEQIKSALENVPVPAELKAILHNLAKYTVVVGGVIFKIGKKVLEIVIYLATKFKKLSFVMIVAAFLSFLIASIPFLGPILFPYLSPIIMLAGLAKGVWEELKTSEPEFVKVVERSGEVFSPLAVS